MSVRTNARQWAYPEGASAQTRSACPARGQSPSSAALGRCDVRAKLWPGSCAEFPAGREFIAPLHAVSAITKVTEKIAESLKIELLPPLRDAAATI
jgi:hypothetical protein